MPETRLVVLESGLGLDSGLTRSIFAGLGLGLGLGLGGYASKSFIKSFVPMFRRQEDTRTSF